MPSQSATSLKQQALILVSLSLVGRSYAYGCYYDNFGNYYCDGLSYGARAGIGVAVVCLILFFILLYFWMRRRRLQKYQQEALQNGYGQNAGMPPGAGYYGAPPPGTEGQPQYYYQQPQPGYQYGADAANWQQPPPTYGVPDSKPPTEPAGYYPPPSVPPPTNPTNGPNRV